MYCTHSFAVWLDEEERGASVAAGPFADVNSHEWRKCVRRFRRFKPECSKAQYSFYSIRFNYRVPGFRVSGFRTACVPRAYPNS